MLQAWINAFRLKTLPLAIGAIIIGSALQPFAFKFEIFAAACVTAVLLQILSNLANDYGDFIKGTDKGRQDRQMNAGSISPKAMKIAIAIFTFLSFASGCVLLYFAFEWDLKYWLIFLGLGILCIIAALMYTMGKRAYGYFGLGDLFVFIFFGLVGVLGTAFLFKQQIMPVQALPAVAYGLMCVGVLNINNIRDLDKDILSNKITIASKLGKEAAGSYQALILLVAVACFLAHHFVMKYTSLAPVGLAILTYMHLNRLGKAKDPNDYNQQLKFLSIGSLGIALLFVFRLYL